MTHTPKTTNKIMDRLSERARMIVLNEPERQKQVSRIIARIFKDYGQVISDLSRT